MRSISHWTLRYLVDRTREKVYRTRHPDEPWLSPQANRFLSSAIHQTDEGIEFGSGRSTLWFAHRVRTLTSIEHDRLFYDRIAYQLHESGFEDRVHYFLHPRQDESIAALNTHYVQQAGGIPDETLDFALVDGIYRDACCWIAMKKIRPGGLLILDDAHRYLPCPSRSPHAIGETGQMPSPLWVMVWQGLKSWHYEWTSNGVSDTALFTKPEVL